MQDETAQRRGDNKMAARLVRSDDVVWEELDGDAVLVSTSLHKTWVLNATAFFVWKSCDGNASVESIASRIAAACGREARKVKAELNLFCLEMEKRGLLRAAHATRCPQMQEQFSATMCLAGLPPMIKMETSMGARGRPSPRNVSGQ